LAQAEKHPFTDADAQQVREYVSHAVCISRARNYETDLARCREIAEGSSVNGTEAAHSSAERVPERWPAPASGWRRANIRLGSRSSAAALGAIGGTAVSHADIRRAINQCLQLRGWTVLDAE
jgi:hypothetical protein